MLFFPRGAGQKDRMIRPATPADADAIDALLRAAFGGPGEAGLVLALRAGPVVAEWVAVQGGAVVGQVMLSAMVAPVGWVALAPLAVAEGARRRGIGAALVRAALGSLRGWRAAAVLGEPGYYDRFGFAPAPGLRGPYPPAFMGLLPLDDPAPDGRAALVYPAAFEGL